MRVLNNIAATGGDVVLVEMPFLPVELTTYHQQGVTMANDPKHVVTRIAEDMFNEHNLREVRFLAGSTPGMMR
jgi:polysaccharide deacetylase 2 family uncharacterized protein YibQ